MYLFYQPLVPVRSVRSARILQDYVVAFTIDGDPNTIVRNPYPVRQPAAYLPRGFDDKVQFFDSGILDLPYVWRGNTESEDVCRKWQAMSST